MTGGARAVPLLAVDRPPVSRALRAGLSGSGRRPNEAVRFGPVPGRHRAESHRSVPCWHRPAAHRSEYHEAGHALCARLLGIEVTAVTRTETRHRPTSDQPDDLRAELVVALGGLAADALAGQAVAFRGGDLRVAADLARRITPDPHGQLEEIGAALALGIRLLRDNRPALRELARTIEARGEIRGADVALVLNTALAQRRP